MRLAFAAMLLVFAVAMATGEFSTGGSDLMKIKGYGIFRLDVWGQEEADPDMGFSGQFDLNWEPTFGAYLAARAELNAVTTNGGQAKLLDGYLDLMPADGITIRGGQFKRNIGWGYLESTTAMIFPDRPMYTSSSDFLDYGGRDVGASVIGTFDPVTIDVAYTNGAGVDVAENDSNKQFTVHAAITPVEWATIGGGLGSYSAYTDSTGDESFSSSAFDVYGLVNYPMTESVTLNFTGELLSLGYAGPDVEGLEKTSGGALTLALGAKFGLNGSLVTGIQPAVRFENVSPATQLATGAEEPTDNYGAIDACVGLEMGPMNTLQLGIRNHSFEAEGADSYTDIILNWRMKF
jgi:hypothetical protein